MTVRVPVATLVVGLWLTTVLSATNASSQADERFDLSQLPAGTIVLEGSPDESPPAEQAHYLGHRDALKPALSVAENLRFWHAFLGGERDSPPAALAAVGLDHIAHLPAGYLSAGQKRRLSMARLVAVRRPLWLLDEPTSALDTAGQALFATLMTDHLAKGGLIVAATHAPLGIATRELRIGGAA